MKKQFLVVTIVSLLFTPQIHAEINMKDASYRYSFSDIQGLRRTYNSRSLYTGYFGFGWCSNFEKSLEINNNKEITVKDCDTDFHFVLTDENNSLKTRTFQNPYTKEKILFKSGTYSHYLQNGEIRMFNRLGQLTNIISSNGTNIAFNYSGKNISSLRTETNYELTFHLNDTNQITKIESSNNESTLYLYEKENLIQSVNSKKQSHLYDYDDMNNMIRLTYPDKTEETIAYNNDQDRVLKINLKNNCTEYYDFYSKDRDQLRQVSTLTRKCDNKTINQYIYEFWYKERSDGLKYLERYKINQNKQTLDITYHPYEGSPISILKNGKELINKI